LAGPGSVRFSFEERIEIVAAALPAVAVSNSAQTRLSGTSAGQKAGPAIQSFAGLHKPAGPAAAVSRQTSAQAAHSPFAQFEALVLQTFIQAMLPKDAESVYGKGLSGDMWQSMLAQKIAEQVARRGGIGIAARLAEDYRPSASQ
jgi:peptidoglycan hydrolase FlgJ